MPYPEPNVSHENHGVLPTCVDLFCGAGGLTLGFCQAGGVPLAAVDNDKTGTETYKRMFPICREVYCGDIEGWEPPSDLMQADVIIGGPPCQGFSLARGLRFVDDPRNHLYKHFIRLVEHFRPSWILMENVQGITNIGKGEILRQVYEDFSEIGYWLDHKVINMAAYGVPQTRKRAIFVGSRDTESFDWPEPTHCPRKETPPTLFGDPKHFVSINDAIGDLPWPRGKYFAHRANSQMRGPRNRDADTEPAFTLRVRGDEFALCDEPATGAFAPGTVPEIEYVYRPATTPFQSLMREEPPPWISGYRLPQTCDRPPQVLIGTRPLAVREQARLQSFPDWFEFAGRPYAQARQIGNAVPPLFARQLFEAVFRHLRNGSGIQNQTSSYPEVPLEDAKVVTR